MFGQYRAQRFYIPPFKGLQNGSLFGLGMLLEI